MICQKCQSPRIAQVSAKCSDCFGVTINSNEHEGYVPKDLGIGGGDYVDFDLCLNCGQMQGTFPLPESEMENNKDVSDIEIAEFFGNYFITGKAVGSLNNKNVGSIKVAAYDISNKFGAFIGEVIDYGSSEGGYGNIFPSVEKFIKFYRDNNHTLDDYEF